MDFGANKVSRRPWPGGGYIHRQKNGADLYIIERKINGVRYHVSTCAHSRRAADKQLEQFEMAPSEYDPSVGLHGESALPFDGQYVLDYFAFMLKKGNTRKHSRQMLLRLNEWAVDLRGKDLRRLSLREHIRPVVERRTNRKHRIIAIKGFFSWLRKDRNLLTSAQDPTLDLPVPQASPEKLRRKKVVLFEHVAGAAAFLAQRERDVLNLLVATGWHVTEVERFIRSKESEIILKPSGADVMAALVMRHKSGDLTSTPVDQKDQLESAQRLKASGECPSRLNATIAAACRKAMVPVFTLGVMRHSVGTWAVESGATVPEVAAFLHHKDASTTRRFYIDTAMPVPGVPIRRLRVVR